MIDLWATLGRACLDGEFRGAVVKAIGPEGPRPFAELEDLRDLLREIHGLRLSLWEVKEIEHAFRTEAVAAMAELDDFWGGVEVSFPADRDFCALIGLACLEEAVRDALEECAGDLAELRRLASSGARDLCPAFELEDPAHYERLSAMLTTGPRVFALMAAVGEPIWRAPCPLGYAAPPAGSPPYLHVDSRQVIDVLDQRGVLEEIEEEGVIPPEVVAEMVETLLDRMADIVSPT